MESFVSLLQTSKLDDSNFCFPNNEDSQTAMEDYSTTISKKLSIKAHILTSNIVMDVENLINNCTNSDELIQNIHLGNQNPQNIMISQEKNTNCSSSPQEPTPKSIEENHSNEKIKKIKKIPYNFAKTAIKKYLIHLINDNFYDDFMKSKLKQNKAFIDRFKKFSLKISYENIKDFKEIWKYKCLIGHDYNDFRVVLRKITKIFLQKEAFNWANNKVKIRKYIPLYKKCMELYLNGLNDVENFKVNDFLRISLEY